MNGVRSVHEMHIDVGCYVVDALDPAERSAFEEHLAGCDSCAREVLEFTETAAELARLVAMGPPRDVRGATLETIQLVRPLPPHTSVPDSIDLFTEPTVELERNPADDSADELADELARRRGRRAGRRQRVLFGLVAAAAVIALALGGLVVNLTQQHQAAVAAQSAAQRETDLLSAPDARVITQARDGGRFTFVVSKQRNQALLLSGDLPDPGPGKVYQLWTLQGRQATPDTTLPAGTGSHWFTGPIAGSTSLAVTAEPAGGSAVPTMPILAQTTI
jgi:anti-sigma factor RsiW